jgi:hypothetical protein
MNSPIFLNEDEFVALQEAQQEIPTLLAPKVTKDTTPPLENNVTDTVEAVVSNPQNKPKRKSREKSL